MGSSFDALVTIVFTAHLAYLLVHPDVGLFANEA
jgi:hypothetical protein